ncbi:MAG: response regulator transcription factor [Dehalococcoidia bacterium]|nr:response regulator transcription factor [Dehalococcoidia bacterium]
MGQTMRVLIVDDHALIRDGIRAMLESLPDIEVVGEAANGQDAIEKTRQLQPDIVMMDLTMPGMGGLEATRHIKKESPEVKVMALTMHENDEHFFQIINAGACGYFIKGGSSTELIAALRTVWQGDVFLYPSMAKKLLGDYLNRVRMGKNQESYDGLTERERDVLKLVAEGKANQEIADILVITVSTVQTHRAHVMAKLGLHSRTELVKYALRRGIISLNT